MDNQATSAQNPQYVPPRRWIPAMVLMFPSESFFKKHSTVRRLCASSMKNFWVTLFRVTKGRKIYVPQELVEDAILQYARIIDEAAPKKRLLLSTEEYRRCMQFLKVRVPALNREMAAKYKQPGNHFVH